MKFSEKWNMLTIKWRWRIISLAITLCFIIAYKYNFTRTADVIANYKKMDNNVKHNKLKKNKNEDSSYILSYLHNFDNKAFVMSVADYNKEDNLSIIELSQYARIEQENMNIETSKLIVQGDYMKIISFLHYLEYIKKSAIISSVNIEMVYADAPKEYLVECTLYVKNIRYENKH